MKEWCTTQGYFNSSGFDGFSSGEYLVEIHFKPRGYKEIYSKKSEFEAVEKTTEWVAKEKGLL